MVLVIGAARTSNLSSLALCVNFLDSATMYEGILCSSSLADNYEPAAIAEPQLVGSEKPKTSADLTGSRRNWMVGFGVFLWPG